MVGIDLQVVLLTFKSLLSNAPRPASALRLQEGNVDKLDLDSNELQKVHVIGAI